MSVKIKILNSKETRVTVSVRRPQWQRYLEY